MDRFDEKNLSVKEVLEIVDAWFKSDETWITVDEKVIPDACIKCKPLSLTNRLLAND